MRKCKLALLFAIIASSAMFADCGGGGYHIQPYPYGGDEPGIADTGARLYERGAVGVAVGKGDYRYENRGGGVGHSGFKAMENPASDTVTTTRVD